MKLSIFYTVLVISIPLLISSSIYSPDLVPGSEYVVLKSRSSRFDKDLKSWGLWGEWYKFPKSEQENYSYIFLEKGIIVQIDGNRTKYRLEKKYHQVGSRYFNYRGYKMRNGRASSEPDIHILFMDEGAGFSNLLWGIPRKGTLEVWIKDRSQRSYSRNVKLSQYRRFQVQLKFLR